MPGIIKFWAGFIRCFIIKKSKEYSKTDRRKGDGKGETIKMSDV